VKSSDELPFDKLREECGVVGIWGAEEAANLTYLSLHALQHRGQEGAGIVTADGDTFHIYRGLGLVGEVFGEEAIQGLPGKASVGHVRYSTTGESNHKNVQPFLVRYRDGHVAIAHNGNLVNGPQLRISLEESGSIFNTTSDTEVILHLIATSQQKTFVNRLVDALTQVKGAYSLVLLTNDKLVAVRDPLGIRPLVMGRMGDAVVFASETAALDLIGGVYEREVEPGEMIIVDSDGMTSLSPLPRADRKACVFEHIYFSRPNSKTFGISVYESRYQMGQTLAKVQPVEADVVIAVPDSGTSAALGYAFASGAPFQQGLIRSHYVGRTFIEPSQRIRDFGVKLKLSPVREVIAGKRVVVVDDSLVRGTTSKKIVRMLRDAGAKAVHVRICSPPIRGSCFYGVDTPTKEELIAHRMSPEEVCEYLGADTLSYLPLDVLHAMQGDTASTYCDACFSLNYPVKVSEEEERNQLGLFAGPEAL